MNFDIKLKRVYKDDNINILATYLDVNDETYYCLSDILDQLHIKENWQISKEKPPLPISAKIIWGFKFDTVNFIETIFIDEKSALNIIKTKINLQNLIAG